MIKDILEQLAPLDAQIAALKGSGSDMEAITAHASELAELAVEEDEILRSCGPLTAEDRVFLARHPEVSQIEICTNNDAPGRWAGERIAQYYQSKYQVTVNLPPREGLDFADLTEHRAALQRAAIR